jgi:hypothetical protein
MPFKIQRRWWPCALLAAGTLLVLVRTHEAERISQAQNSAPSATTRVRPPQLPWRQIAAMRGKPRRAVSEHDGGARLRQLSDLDRTPDDNQLLWAAEEQLVAGCMSKRGFSYLPNGKDDDPDMVPGHVTVDRRSDVAAARATGYRLAAQIQGGDSPIATSDRNAASLARMTDAERAAFLEALRGPSISPADPSMQRKVESVPLPGGGRAYWYRDSCLAETRRRLYGEDYEHNEIGYGLASLRSELLTMADASPEYRKALDAWRDCMGNRGFHDDQPQGAAKRLAAEYHAGKLSLDELRTQEVTVATADTECFMTADLGRVRQAAEARAEEVVLARHAEELMAMRRVRDDALARAEAVLSDADP